MIIDEAFSDVVVAVDEVGFDLSGVEVAKAIAEQRIVHVGIVIDVVVGIATYFVIVDRRAVLNGGNVGNDDALSVIIDLIVVDVGINCCLNASFVVQNALVLTKYSGQDPEIGGGIDNNFYPRPRVYSVNLTFDF